MIMPTFHVLLAQDVSVYGYADIEAEAFEAAIDVARAQLDAPQDTNANPWDNVTDVEWHTATRPRIVNIENLDTGEERDGIDLDGPNKLTIWTLVIDNDGGTETEVYTSKAQLDAAARAIVVEAWTESDGPMPADWWEAYEHLHDTGYPDFWLSTKEHEITLP